MNRFLSFADSRMSAALERLGRQAEALDFFDEITLFTEHDLSAEFTSRMGRYGTPPCMRKRSGNTVTKSENGRRSTDGLPVPVHPGASSFVIDKKKTPHTLCTVSTLLSP